MEVRLSHLLSKTILGLSLVIATACGDRTPPVIHELTIAPNPNPAAPLAAILSLRADEPVRVRLRIKDGSDEWDSSRSDRLESEQKALRF